MLKQFLFIQAFQKAITCNKQIIPIKHSNFAGKDSKRVFLVLKMDTDMGSTNQTGMNKGHKGFHMHNRTYRKTL